MEDAARTARHAFFDRARVASGLMSWPSAIRSTINQKPIHSGCCAAQDRGGWPPCTRGAGATIRPLLDCRRDDLRQDHLDGSSLRFVHDTSNDDATIPRNRVRAELLPCWSTVQSFDCRRLADQAELAREEWLWMSAEADALASRIGRREGARWCVWLAGLLEAPRALARLLLQEVMTAAAGGRHDHSRTRRTRDRPGQASGRRSMLRANVSNLLMLSWFSRAGPRAPSVAGIRCRRLFTICSRFRAKSRCPNWGVWCPSRRPTQPGKPAASHRQRTSRSSEKRAVQALAVRNRRTGDRFRPIGLGGTKKLQDFFVDRKIARRRAR